MIQELVNKIRALIAGESETERILREKVEQKYRHRAEKLKGRGELQDSQINR